MQGSKVSPPSGKTYTVRFLGEPVECESLEHAAAVQHASDIFSGLDASQHPRELLERLAGVSDHYGHPKAALVLREQAQQGS